MMTIKKSTDASQQYRQALQKRLASRQGAANRRDKTDRQEVIVAALSYQPKDEKSAPVVLASGKGWIASQILEEALEHEIPIHKDPDLVEILAATELGEEIPVEAFIAVAEILRYIYEINGTKPPRPPVPEQEAEK